MGRFARRSEGRASNYTELTFGAAFANAERWVGAASRTKATQSRANHTGRVRGIWELRASPQTRHRLRTKEPWPEIGADYRRCIDDADEKKRKEAK